MPTACNRTLRNATCMVLWVLAILGATGPLQGAAKLNQVGSLLVYPAVFAVDHDEWYWETFITFTNAGASDIVARVSFVNGDATDSRYCDECSFSLSLTPNDTETLVVRYDDHGAVLEAEDGMFSYVCPHSMGMIIVAAEDPDGETITSNVLFGEEVVINYMAGYAYSLPAIPFQGDSGDGDRNYELDGNEYGRMPRFVGADFLAPDLEGDPLAAELVVFTLGFSAQHPPEVDCSVTGYDADENAFSTSFRFGCWALADLCELSPEFCYPDLGLTYGQPDTHGWLGLNCRVDAEGDGEYEAAGGVHGAIVQRARSGAVLRRNHPQAPSVAGAVAWARLLQHSVTDGDELTLRLLGDFDPE